MLIFWFLSTNIIIQTRLISKAEREEIDHAFQLFDTENTGEISVKDVREALEDADPETRAIFAKLPEKGVLTSEEFAEFLLKRKGEPHDLDHVFTLFDKDTKGYIGVSDLKQIAHDLGEQMSDEELEEMIQRADSNRDGRVSRNDFKEVMTKKLWSWVNHFWTNKLYISIRVHVSSAEATYLEFLDICILRGSTRIDRAENVECWRTCERYPTIDRWVDADSFAAREALRGHDNRYNRMDSVQSHERWKEGVNLQYNVLYRTTNSGNWFTFNLPYLILIVPEEPLRQSLFYVDNFG